MGLRDHFAEALSEHGDINRAAAKFGQSPATGRRWFREICEKLGPQAR